MAANPSKKMEEMQSLLATGLSASVAGKIQSVFRQYPQIETVVLYGSRAKANYRQGSDIDLTIKLKPGIAPDLNLHHRLAAQLDDLNLVYTIDLSFYQQINNPDLIEHIDRVGVVFYESGEVTETS